MPDTSARPAADELAPQLGRARLAGTVVAGIAREMAPPDEAAAYAAQDRLHAWLAEHGHGPRVGWKIGCTTPVMQRYLGIDSPCAGGLFAPTVHHSPARLGLSDYASPGIECEIAVRLGADLPPRAGGHDRDSVAAAVARLHPAFEIVDARFADWRRQSTPTLIADDFFGAGCVLGPGRDDWRSLDLAALAARVTVDGRAAGSGRGADVMGHPFVALAWLADALERRGQRLRAGDLVLTGSLVQTVWIAAPADAIAVIDGLGEVRAAFV